MRIIENDAPTPRLLVTAANERPAPTAPAPVCSGKLRHNSGWAGNAFAIFIGIALGALLLCGASTFMITRHTAAAEERGPVRIVAVASPHAALVAKPEPALLPEAPQLSAKSAPVTVHITPDLFRVTAISLGHPRLAVINRQQVSEGDWIEVATPTGQIAVKLHVIKIADGGIELLVGNQVISVPIAQLKLKPL